MNAKQFRFHYLLSLGLTIVAVVIFIVALGMLILSSAQTINSELLNATNNPDALVKVVWNLGINILLNSIYSMLAIGLYIVGALWNIVISYMRADTQDDHALTLIVVAGWAASVLLPIIGLVIYLVAQIWGWFQGSKETTVITS